MGSSLGNLHQQFSLALQNHHYLASSEDQQTLIVSQDKQMRLAEVFEKARIEIENYCQNSSEDNTSELRQLKNDGARLYQIYETKTHRWTRRFLKTIHHLTPAFIKRFLPKCFSIEEVELNTAHLFSEYNNTLTAFLQSPSVRDRSFLTDPLPPQPQQLVEELKELFASKLNQGNNGPTSPIEPSTPQVDSLDIMPVTIEANPEEIELPTESASTNIKTDLENKRVYLKENCFKCLQEQLQYLKHFNEILPSVEKYSLTLKHFIATIRLIYDLTPSSTEKEEFTTFLEQEGFNPASLFSLAAFDSDSIKNLSPSHYENLQKAANQGFIRFGYSKPRASVVLQTNTNERVRSNEFSEYKGILDLKLTTSSDEALKKLIEFLQAHPACQPNVVKISFLANLELAPSILEELMQLSELVPEIQLIHLKTLNLKNLNLSTEQEINFIRQLKKFTCPDSEEIILTDQSKAQWTVDDFSTLLAFCPTLAMLNLCYIHCSTPQKIILPAFLREGILRSNKILNLRDYPLDSLSDLLFCFYGAQHLDLGQHSFNNEQLKIWQEAGLFNPVQTLNLKECETLTTDCLFDLISLPVLRNLILPDLKEGTTSLDLLPTSKDPFKLSGFYCSSATTAPLALKLYTGPSEYATAIQIPAARLGIKPVFKAEQSVLTATNVACWLYQNDYQKLEAEPAVRTLVAERNPYLTDENIFEFIQKFPGLKILKLRDCPNITNTGIQALLQALYRNTPQLIQLDLTGCNQISAEPFKGASFKFSSLERLVLSGTQVTPEQAQEIERACENKKIICETQVLTITNDQLTDENALETLLSSQNLFNLTQINLQDCTNLTNEMLQKLLDRFNTDIVLLNYENNPQRLNLATLNLTGCTGITNGAFEDKIVEGKPTLKILENLECLVIGGTGLTPIIQELYPLVKVQQEYQPILSWIEPSTQANLMHANLFLNQEEKIEKLKDQPDFDKSPFPTFKLSFQTYEDRPLHTIETYKQSLYNQAGYFVPLFRPGGISFLSSGLTLTNQHATPEAGDVIQKLLAGDVTVCDSLEWEVAADAAYLAGDELLDLDPLYKQKLQQRMKSQFALERADDMILKAEAMQDKKALQEYEETLLWFFENFNPMTQQDQQQTISNLAKGHASLSKLLSKVQQVERARSDELIAKEMAEAEETPLINIDDFLDGF